MFKKAYVEITNRCNLKCSFCPGTKRPLRDLTAEEFDCILGKLQGHVQYIYLHVMGEPLLHPDLALLMQTAQKHGMQVCITTNGTLLARQRDVLLDAENLHKISISLHSAEGNGKTAHEAKAYWEEAFSFASEAAQKGVITVLRLWNDGGADTQNAAIVRFLQERTGKSDWDEVREDSFRLAPHLYLEHAKKFEWPDRNAAEQHTEFCYGLRDQIAVLSDGTVVPCCLDHEGDIPLGNLFEDTLEEIMRRERTQAMLRGFAQRKPSEELCRRCAFATRFNR